MNTQRAMRRLKPDPVPDELIWKLLDAAVKAPSGGNRQPWNFIVIRDAETKAKIAEWYLESWNTAYGPFRQAALASPATAGTFSSAVQNLMLAARALGLGTTLTTLHRAHEDEVKQLLGIPDGVETMCLIPVGYPRGKFGPTTRIPAEKVTFWEKWGGARER